MPNLKPLVWLGILLVCPVSGFPQTQRQIDRKVYQKLKQIRPKNTKTATYSIVLPKERVRFPEALQVDIVYQVGHYARELGALRFESTAVYIITAMFAFYLNFFVLVAQSFQKVPALKPMDGGPVFLATQVAALLFFIIATVFSIKRFRA